MRLCIAIPSGDTWKTNFALNLILLTNVYAARAVPGYAQQTFSIHNKRSSILLKSRRELIEGALAGKFTHLLFLDTDQTFPPELIHELIKWQKPVVACNVATKSIPASPTARNQSASGWMGGDPVFTDPDSKGLQQVWRIGTGVMLIDLSIMDRVPKPWFGSRWDESVKDDLGEDWWFCEQLEKANIPIYIDHDVSKKVGHLGDLEYTHDLVGELKKEVIDGEAQTQKEQRWETA